MLNMMELRLVASAAIIRVGGNAVYNADPLEGREPLPDPERPKEMAVTALPHMRRIFYDTGAKTESLRRIIGKAHQEFQRLTEALEAMADDSDFWSGIEPSV